MLRRIDRRGNRLPAGGGYNLRWFRNECLNTSSLTTVYDGARGGVLNMKNFVYLFILEKVIERRLKRTVVAK
ncbi:hypothetical protein Hanom_Chr08g00710061 [Helianthus anomalus]